MEIARLLEGKETGKIYCLLGNIDITTNRKNMSIINNYNFNGSVKSYLNSQKDISSLKMLNLNESYLNKTSVELSESELRAINLAKSLIENKEFIILNYYEKGFSNKEQEHYKRLLRKLSKDYNKTILIYTNDLNFILDIVEEIIIVDRNEVVHSIPKNQYYEILEMASTPEIVKFIELIRKKGIKIDNYTDIKDLLKAIYRLKEQEK